MKSGDDSRAPVAAHLRDRAAAYSYARFFAFHPVHLVSVAFPVLLQQLGSLRLEYEHLSRLDNLALISGRLFVYFLVLLLVFPRVLRWGLKRNIPYIALHYGFWFLGAAVFAVVMALLVDERFASSPQPLRFIRQQVFVVPLLVVMVYYFQDDIRTRLGQIPALVPVWRPVRADEVQEALRAEAAMAVAAAQPNPPQPLTDARVLDPSVGGQVRALQAQNQYVMVITDAGQKLIRETINAAIERLPEGAGVRVHRSWWVSRQELAGLRLVDGGTRLQGADGVSYPVSRSRRDAVREALGRL